MNLFDREGSELACQFMLGFLLAMSLTMVYHETSHDQATYRSKFFGSSGTYCWRTWGVPEGILQKTVFVGLVGCIAAPLMPVFILYEIALLLVSTYFCCEIVCL